MATAKLQYSRDFARSAAGNHSIQQEKKCACKGIRKCALCSHLNFSPSRNGDSCMVSPDSHVTREDGTRREQQKIYSYCYACQKGYLIPEVQLSPELATALAEDVYSHCFNCPLRSGNEVLEENDDDSTVELDGMTLRPDFVTSAEEAALTEKIDGERWIDSQSGRRKQDFGPRVNFKKQKVKIDDFHGLPGYSRFLLDRMTQLPDFRTVELCNLEYLPDRGSHIDAHTDDTWLWGRRLVSVNLLSGTLICLTCDDEEGKEVWAAMPKRSLFVMDGTARFKWKHAIRPEHIRGRRLVMTFRELSQQFLTGEDAETGREILAKAETFLG